MVIYSDELVNFGGLMVIYSDELVIYDDCMG